MLFAGYSVLLNIADEKEVCKSAEANKNEC
jgi:hypothetical protein